MELGYGRQLFVVDCGGGVLDGTGQEVEGVDDSVLSSDLWLGEVFMEFLDSVRDDDGFCCCIDNLEAVVVIERGGDGETFAAAEVPRSTGAWFGMDDDWAAERSYGGNVEVEGTIEVLPGGYVRGNAGLAEEV